MELVEVYSANEVILAYQVADLLALYPEKSKFLIILNDLSHLEKLALNLNFFLKDCTISSYLPWDVLPYDTVSPTISVTANRLSSLYFLSQENKQFILTTPEALLQKTFSPQYFSSKILQLHLEKSLTPESLVEHLESCGYQRTSLVEEVGQYTLRGSIVDFFPAHDLEPIRIEFYLDQIHSIRSFETESQRSVLQLKQFEIFPIKELVLPDLTKNSEKEAIFRRIKEAIIEQDLSLNYYKTIEDSLNNNLIFPGIEFIQSFWFQKSAFSAFLTESSITVVVKKDLLKEQILDFENVIQERLEIAEVRENLRTPPTDNYLSSEELFNSVIFNNQASIKNKSAISPLVKLGSNLLAAKHTDFPLKPLAEEIKRRQKEGYRTAFVLSSARRLNSLKEILAAYEIKIEEIADSFFNWEKTKEQSSDLSIFFAELEHGFSDQEKKLLLISEKDVFPDAGISRRKAKSSKIRKFLGSLSQLKENDFIVHLEHGVGIYRGLRQFDVEGKIGDFLHLEYAEGAKLYLPVENIGKLQKYAGASANKTPALTKLGGKVWSATKAKVKENVAELAGQLLKLIAQRETSKGLRFEPYNEEDREFAGTFNYSETPDQAKAITEVLEDLSQAKPMDRLVCGDVGYGKTEVAIRAAFKAVQSGYQVAILVPTTILADQHYQTFFQRFADSPIRIAMLSRFKSKEQNKEVLDQLSLGQVDIVIGTHKLIQKDVSFKNLGLLIIDEEHRFGVAHKEKLKRLRADVHVLTLSATPIPRTLHQSLVGIRDLSLIETPPVNRQSIKTFIAQYSDSIVKEAIQREISRGGQAFYIYNRVDNISLIADYLSNLVPNARIVYGHGQMKEHELEKIMHKFVNGEIDVLVSTTIVESGLDIPNANTIIIRNAERFGLAELYQLRGRVGRSARRAYAYLLIPDPKTLGADAKKRIDILRSLDDLGIGFRLALQDMEIRGAGNLLGKDQSGHVDLVGYELYSRILKEAIDELKRAQRKVSEGERKNIPQVDPEMRIGFPAHIPEFYVPDVSERLILYQRLIDLNGEDGARAFFEEIEDRFGALAQEVSILIELMLFRSLLKDYGILTANYSAGVLSFSFHPEASPATENLFNSLQQFKDLLKISPSMVFSLRLIEKEINSPRALYLELKEILGSLFA